MNKKTSRKRPQNQKPNKHANPAMHAAMVELRQGSRTSPHRMRNRVERGDFRRMAQKGVWE